MDAGAHLSCRCPGRCPGGLRGSPRKRRWAKATGKRDGGSGGQSRPAGAQPRGSLTHERRVNGRLRTLGEQGGPEARRARPPTLRGFPRHTLLQYQAPLAKTPAAWRRPFPPASPVLPRRARAAGQPCQAAVYVQGDGGGAPAPPAAGGAGGEAGLARRLMAWCRSSRRRRRRQRVCFLQRVTGYLRGGKQKEIRFVLESPPPAGDDLSSTGSNVRSRGASGHAGGEDRGVPVPQP